MDSRLGWSDVYPRDEEPIPTYEESVKSAPSKGATQTKIQTFSERIAQVQRNRIHNLIENDIEPLLSEHADSGLFKASFALILSDVSLLQHGSDKEAAVDTLLNFPQDEHTCVVRLKGEENSSRFWQQPVVTRDLELALRKRLHIDLDQDTATSSKVQEQSPSIASTQNTSWRWMLSGKKSQSRERASAVIPKFSQAGAGWKAEEIPSDKSRTSLGVSCEDVYIRIQTDLGLYQTRHCPALVVRLNIRH